MLRAMIDTMVFDSLSADPADREAVLEAVRTRRLLLLTTPVQEAQLADIADPVKRKRLQTIPREVVPSSAPVLGVSRAGRPRLGPGAESEALRVGTRHAGDEIIADVAATRADTLVTEDRRLASDACNRGMTVWSVADLVAWTLRPPG
jgi:hypothetical protein